MKAVLHIENVSKSYLLGKIEVPVLNDINLTINEGEFAAIMGPSGSGKSTLMNIIGCLDRPTSGKIVIADMDISKLSEIELARIRGKKIGFVFQTFNLISRLTAQKNVELPMVYQDVPGKMRDKRAKALLELLGLGERTGHKPAELSGGQRQRAPQVYGPFFPPAPAIQAGLLLFYPSSFREHPGLSLIHISEPTRLGMLSYAVFC